MWNVIPTSLLIDTYIRNVSVQSSNTKNIILIQMLNFCWCLMVCYNALVMDAGSTCVMKYTKKNIVFSLLAV